MHSLEKTFSKARIGLIIFIAAIVGQGQAAAQLPLVPIPPAITPQVVEVIHSESLSNAVTWTKAEVDEYQAFYRKFYSSRPQEIPPPCTANGAWGTFLGEAAIAGGVGAVGGGLMIICLFVADEDGAVSSLYESLRKTDPGFISGPKM